MRLLVTGAAGFIGRHVLAQANAAGIDLVGIGRTRPPSMSRSAFIESDLLRDEVRVEQLAALRPTDLLHLAWVTTPGEYWQSPLNEHWGDATARLVETFFRAGGEHVVGAGSCAEYAWRGAPCVEDNTPLQPATPYGRAKHNAHLRVSQLAAAYQRHYCWARLFLLYGAGEASRRLVPSVVASLRGEAPPVPIGLSLARDLLHVDDAASALLHLVQAKVTDAINVCAGHATQLSTLVHLAARLLDADPAPLLARARTPRPDEPATLTGDNTRLCATGWRPRVSLARGLAASIESRVVTPTTADLFLEC